MNPAPAFQVYARDELLAADELKDPLEFRALWIIRFHEWMGDGGFELDEKRWARRLRISENKFRAVWEAIRHLFEEHDGRWHSPSLQTQREKQAEHRAKSSFGGKLSAKLRAAGRTPNDGTPPDGEARPLQPEGKGTSTTLEGDRQGVGNLAVAVCSLHSADCVNNNKDSAADAAVELVVAHYKSVHPARRPGKKERSIVSRALKVGYTGAELCEAIDGNAIDSWHVERNKHDLAYVLRDNGKIDNFRAKSTATPPTESSPRRLRATEQILGEDFADDPVPPDVCEAAWQSWCATIGAVDQDRLRKALRPVYQSAGPHPTADELKHSIEAFDEARDVDKPAFRFKYSVEAWTADLTHYIDFGKLPIVDEWGIPTARGAVVLGG